MALWPFKSAIEKHVDSAIEEQIFEQVAREMHSNEIRPGLWAKAFSESNGDPDRARARYISLRANSIVKEIAAQHELWAKTDAQQSNVGFNGGSMPSERPTPIAAAPTNLSTIMNKFDEEKIYEDAANEVDSGNVQKGLWTKLWTELEGDDDKVKLAYIKTRVAQITARVAQITAEEQEAIRLEQEDNRSAAEIHKQQKAETEQLHDYHKDFARFKKLAEQGDAMAQSNLGLMYTQGQGVPKDEQQAVVWYRTAAEQGYAHAQFNLGWRYANGQGVPKDEKMSYFWSLLASAQGNQGAAQLRDLVEPDLSPEQRAAAQASARNWKPKIAPQSSGVPAR